MSSEKDKVNDFSYSPNLFKRDDGTSMEFFINYSSDSKEVAPLILEGGGIIVNNIDNADVRNSRIICLGSNAESLKTRSDLVCSSFIYASCISDRCLDLKDFRLQPLEKSRTDSVERESTCKSSPNERFICDFKMLWSIVKNLAKEQDIWKSFCVNNKEFGDVSWKSVRKNFIIWAFNCIKLTGSEQLYSKSTPFSSQSKGKHLDENILQDDLGESNENPKDEHSGIFKEPNVKEQISEPLPLKEQRKESVDGENKVDKRGSEWLGKDLLRNKLRTTNRNLPIGELDDGSTSTEGSDTDLSFITDEEEGVNATPRRPRSYSCNEDLMLLKWIILRRNNITSLTGNRIWKFIEKRKVLPNRSWQSMRERFRKQIMPNIIKYPLSKEEINQLRKVKKLRQLSEVVSKKYPLCKKNSD